MTEEDVYLQKLKIRKDYDNFIKEMAVKGVTVDRYALWEAASRAAYKAAPQKIDVNQVEKEAFSKGFDAGVHFQRNR